ncbi:acid--CoA ligase [Mycolicibacterium chitae]|uniref:AMP-dependent synthetase and ligase n=1 Tax=Mycolicibacterium chitae TaxID=1792 RepID=A0A448IA18_MYCCI|nr:AMP-binding protein [Mycolicibacterium chitae]MCV7105049.1 AMP-binding protein [Mycolicibacterium chitae]BBZ05671.1 acid--CoA ligase [Mycolicibacterium chitae]VEG49282.1 AMP-dependent synthetase and ligase [Mycolicibacterium chitae]
MSGTVIDALAWWARTKPDFVAIDFDGDELTYGDLNTWADGVAADLISVGVTAGDRVSILGSNSLEWCAAALGAFKVGAIVAPFNQRMVARELGVLVGDCEPKVVFYDETTKDRLDEVHSVQPTFAVRSLDDEVRQLRRGGHPPSPVRAPDLDEATAIVYTSGTTSAPKGVVFTHGTIAGVMHDFHLVEGVEPGGPRQLMVLPLFGAPGLIWGICRIVLHGGTLLLQPGFDPRRALEVLATKRVTTLIAVPLLLERMAAEPGFAAADLRSIATAHVGGARVPAELLKTWHAKGVVLRQLYGQTEIGGTATVMPREEALQSPEKCGWGSVFTKIRVVDENDVDVPAGTPGQILLRGPGMMPGYWRNGVATEAALKGGWLHTGDIGVLDERGYLTFVERQKDMIISGGLNIAPMEIEMVLQDMPGVAEVAVFGVSDPKFGETPAALINAGASVSTDAVVDWCNQRLADFKVPRYVVFTEEPLPRLASGKIAKRELRDTYADIPERHPKVR